MANILPPDYKLHTTACPLDEYLQLRHLAGLTPKTHAQAEAALPGSWYAVHIKHIPTSATVGMGRIVSDGGWYFVIADIAVLPEHQRKGLGQVILGKLMEKIKECTVEGRAYVTLMAKSQGMRLYERFGFRNPEPRTVGMAVEL